MCGWRKSSSTLCHGMSELIEWARPQSEGFTIAHLVGITMDEELMLGMGYEPTSIMIR